DPEVDVTTYLQPALPSGGSGPPMAGGGPPMAGGGPPMAGGGPPMAGGGPPMGGGKAGPPMGGGNPGIGPPKPPNPKAEKLSKATKAMLRDIHAKYGTTAKSHLPYVVRDGEQTFDIKLK